MREDRMRKIAEIAYGASSAASRLTGEKIKRFLSLIRCTRFHLICARIPRYSAKNPYPTKKENVYGLYLFSLSDRYISLALTPRIQLKV